MFPQLLGAGPCGTRHAHRARCTLQVRRLSGEEQYAPYIQLRKVSGGASAGSGARARPGTGAALWRFPHVPSITPPLPLASYAHSLHSHYPPRPLQVKDHFIFTIESTGAWRPHELFGYAVDLMVSKCDKVLEGLQAFPGRSF